MGDEFSIPVTHAKRIIGDVSPDGFHVTKDARSAVSRAAQIFVSYLTTTANDIAQRSHKRATVFASDVLDALKTLEFESFVPTLERDLEAFREEMQHRKEKKAKKMDEEGQQEDKVEEVVVVPSQEDTPQNPE
eukprot:TRINITY_DN314_c0_g6_i1.p2 TRINITY_DN314_c0_g6~~TRINITY_DN314_c0_g6_i1.p2  ORF type:complete len:133 (+),score=46.80 TRINITY_DN314_c0_g6_i1:120-518(+)